MSDCDGVIKKLKEYFKKRDDIVMAFLFGSQANKRAHSGSDWDIAVYFKPKESAVEYEEYDREYPEEDKIWGDLIDILKTDNVDLLVLNRTPANIADSAIRGVSLVVKDRGLWLKFMLIITALAEDFRKFTDDYYAIYLRSTSLTPQDSDRLERTIEFIENKELMDALVGTENNHGCSGGGSKNDWVTAATLAGFDYINGIVGMHVYGIEQKNRPNPEWDDKFIEKEAYHYNVPEDLEDRIYLIKLKDLEDFEHDEDGTLVISSGELGRLDTLAEGSSDCLKTNCPLTSEDTDAFVAIVKEVNAYRDSNRIAKLNLYFPSNNFVEENEDALRYFFSEMQKLQDEGILEWATQWELVETYLESLN